MENKETENYQGNLYIPKQKIPDLLNWRANVVTSTRDGKQYVVREHRFVERKTEMAAGGGLSIKTASTKP